MDAVQTMRQKAQQAGNLKSTPQQTVETQGSTVVIQPADPQIVYVPAYNPWAVYGYPLGPWPGWYPYPGIWFGGPYLSFGIGFGVGFYGGYGWGWNRWGMGWGNHTVIYNNNRYYSHSNTFYNRNAYYRGGGANGGYHPNANGNIGGHGGVYNGGHSGVYNRPGATTHPFNGNNQAARGYAEPHPQTGTRSDAFDGYDHGGQARSYSSRGSGSFGGGGSRGGGGGFGGGGGGSRGGGGGGGGHR
jgi:Protein of unknown function (DUF3300)